MSRTLALALAVTLAAPALAAGPGQPHGYVYGEFAVDEYNPYYITVTSGQLTPDPGWDATYVNIYAINQVTKILYSANCPIDWNVFNGSYPFQGAVAVPQGQYKVYCIGGFVNNTLPNQGKPRTSSPPSSTSP
jgi:hypothetical protein